MASKRLQNAVGKIDPERVVSAALEAALGEMEQPRKKRHPGRVLAAGAALATAAAVGQRRMPLMARVPLKMGLHKLGDMTHVEGLADALHDRADALHDRLVGRDDDEAEDADLADDEDFDEDAPDGDSPDDEGEEDFDDEDGEDFDDEDGDDFDDGPEDDDGPRDEGDAEEPEPDDEEDLDDVPDDEASEDDLPEDEEPEDVDDEEDLQPDDEEEDDEEVAARSLDLGVASERDAAPARDTVPDLFEALGIRRRRAPVMRRGSTRRVDPAARPPEPAAGRHSDERRGSSRKSKPTARA